MFCGCAGKQGEIPCDKPYMRYGDSCCLDSDENNICDWHEPRLEEAATTTKAKASSRTTSASITTTSTVITTSTTSTTIIVSMPIPRHLNRFRVTEDGSNMVFYFYLTDENNSEVIAPGIISFSLYNSRRMIYSGIFNVSEKDYSNTTIGLGMERHLLFIGRVPIYNINRSLLRNGRAEMVFNLSDGSHFEVSNNEIILPVIPIEEYEDYSMDRYLKSATPMGLEETKNGLRVEVVRAGYITLIDEKTGKDENTYLRVDLVIDNIGSVDRRFNAYGALLRVDSVDYWSFSGSSISSRELISGADIEEYLLFGGVPDLSGKNFDLFAGTSIDKNSQRVEYWFNNLTIY